MIRILELIKCFSIISKKSLGLMTGRLTDSLGSRYCQRLVSIGKVIYFKFLRNRKEVMIRMSEENNVEIKEFDMRYGFERMAAITAL
jgi:hypothetical protein